MVNPNECQRYWYVHGSVEAPGVPIISAGDVIFNNKSSNNNDVGDEDDLVFYLTYANNEANVGYKIGRKSINYVLFMNNLQLCTANIERISSFCSVAYPIHQQPENCNNNDNGKTYNSNDVYHLCRVSFETIDQIKSDHPILAMTKVYLRTP